MHRSLFNDPTIERARLSARSDAEASAVLDAAKHAAAPLIAKSEDAIRALLPPASTKRAFMVHKAGCPIHGGGTSVYQPFGTQVDLDLPLRVRCPIGGEVYPNSDFPDNGEGWVDDRPDSLTRGDRYYFVGWFVHWMWNSIGGHVKRLAQLWILTGDETYLLAGRALLERIAEVYPDLSGDDLTYDGLNFGWYVKMTGTYWEGPILTDMAKGIDLFLPGLPDNLVNAIYTKVYPSAYHAYRAKPAASNWGNLWNTALATFATILQDDEIKEFMLQGHPAALLPVLDNQFFRDGIPHEASLTYSYTYLDVIRTVAEVSGMEELWDHPHLRATYPAYTDLVCLDRFTHFAADMGGLQNDGWTLGRTLIEAAYRHERTPVLARYLLQALILEGEARFRSLDDLFLETFDVAEVRRFAQQAPSERSTLAPVRGLAIVRTGEGINRTALYLDYGFAHRAHHHADRLNINLFSHGREWIPEMGYPEYMDGQAPATGGWTTHTVCHATVEVDAHRQAVSVFGDLHAFVETDGVRLMDASCEDAYACRGVDTYRRTLLLIDLPNGRSYVVDLFRVRGSHQHDYLFHGPPVPVEVEGVTLSSPMEGTLAGPDVAFGQAPGGLAPYAPENSGYQYLFNVRQGEWRGSMIARWTFPECGTLSAHFLSDTMETFFLTDGYPRPSSKSLPSMPFLVWRRTAGGGTVESRFVNVFAVNRRVRADLLPVDGTDATIALRVRYDGGEDLILSALSPSGEVRAGGASLQGTVGLIRRWEGQPVRAILIGGTALQAGDVTLTVDQAVEDMRVEEVEDDRLILNRPALTVQVGEILLVDRGPVRSAYRIEGVTGKILNISPTTWIGRGRVGEVDTAQGIVRDGRRIFLLGTPSLPPGARNYYAGAWIVNEARTAWYRLHSGGDDGFILAGNQNLSRLVQDFPAGSVFLLYDLGPGDRVYRLNSVVSDGCVVFKEGSSGMDTSHG
ncbi:MAG: heparinase II/III family protein [Candidatus Latescibacteria bacterium]|nr:heparinase II/III family protein [Candidatus Latescibacterota bacterium]